MDRRTGRGDRRRPAKREESVEGEAMLEGGETEGVIEIDAGC